MFTHAAVPFTGLQGWGRVALGGLMDPSDLVPQILLGATENPSSSTSRVGGGDRSGKGSSSASGREGVFGTDRESVEGKSRGSAPGKGSESGSEERGGGERGDLPLPGDEDEQDFSSGGLSGRYGNGDAEDGGPEDPYAEAEDFAARLYDVSPALFSDGHPS